MFLYVNLNKLHEQLSGHYLHGEMVLQSYGWLLKTLDGVLDENLHCVWPAWEVLNM